MLPRLANRAKSLVPWLLGAALLLSALLPAPYPASAGEAVVTATASVAVNPIEVSIWAPSQARVGMPFLVLAFIENHGDTSVESAVAIVHPPGNIQVLLPAAGFSLGTVPAHGFSAALWLVRATKKGDYAILVTAFGIYGSAIVTDEDVALVTIKGR